MANQRNVGPYCAVTAGPNSHSPEPIDVPANTTPGPTRPIHSRQPGCGGSGSWPTCQGGKQPGRHGLLGRAACLPARRRLAKKSNWSPCRDRLQENQKCSTKTGACLGAQMPAAVDRPIGQIAAAADCPGSASVFLTVTRGVRGTQAMRGSRAMKALKKLPK